VGEYAAGLDDLFADRAMVNWRADLDGLKGRDLDLAASFLRSWQEVGEEEARRLFLLAGSCAPNQPIPCELLEAAAGLDVAGCDEALALLTGLGLLEMEDPGAGPTIHPLLAEYARTLPGAGDEMLSRLAGALAPLASEANRTGLPAEFAPLRPHLEALAPAAEAAGVDEAGRLWNELGWHLDDVADYAGARAAYERALAIDEAAFGPQHPNVATDVNNLGWVLKALGDLAGARAAYERALAIDQRTYGSQHPNVARDVNNLGSVLQALGDLAGARAAYERALAIDQRTYGSQHPNVAIRVNNLGSVLQALGDLAGARAALERALAIFEAFDDPRAEIPRRFLEQIDA
jgi:Tfp pilus assembly protein PilF